MALKGNGTGVVAFNKYTGNVHYKITDELASYSVPVLATIGERRWCFVFARGGLIGFDPANGKVDFHYPWRAPILESVNAACPVVVGNKVLISETYGPGSALLEVHPGGYKEIWTDEDKKRDKSLQCHWNTPIHVDGYVYGCSGRHENNAELRCIELATGKVMWSEPGLARTSLLLVDGHFVCQAEDGILLLLKVNPKKYDEISRVQLQSDGQQLAEGAGVVGADSGARPALRPRQGPVGVFGADSGEKEMIMLLARRASKEPLLARRANECRFSAAACYRHSSAASAATRRRAAARWRAPAVARAGLVSAPGSDSSPPGHTAPAGRVVAVARHVAAHVAQRFAARALVLEARHFRRAVDVRRAADRPAAVAAVRHGAARTAGAATLLRRGRRLRRRPAAAGTLLSSASPSATWIVLRESITVCVSSRRPMHRRSFPALPSRDRKGTVAIATAPSRSRL